MVWIDDRYEHCDKTFWLENKKKYNSGKIRNKSYITIKKTRKSNQQK